MTISDKEIREKLDAPEPTDNMDGVKHMLDWDTASRDWIPNALARIQVARELHRPFPVMGTSGQMLTGQPLQRCITCHREHPCPTWRALEGNMK